MGKKRLKVVDTAKTKLASSGEKKSQPDLYSQIFPDNSDSEMDDTPINQYAEDNDQSSLTKVPGPQNSLTASTMAKKGKEKLIRKVDGPPITPKVIEKKGNKVKKGLVLPPQAKIQAVEVSSDSEAGDFEFDDDDDDDDEIKMESTDSDNEADESKVNDSDEEQSSDNEDESEDDIEGTPKTILRKQLKDLSFEELESLKQKMGLKEYNEAMFASRGKTVPKNKKKRKFERTNKNRPREISSKVRVPKLRQVVKVPKGKETKDPRFDSSCGEFNEKIWNTEYNFIRDIQKKEAEEMKKKIKSVDSKSKQKEMRRFIQRVTDKEKAIEMKQREEKKRIQDKEENRKRVEEGKRPFYMKQSTKKLVELVEKYDELKSSGKLEKYLKKKRKKNAIRDKKTLNG